MRRFGASVLVAAAAIAILAPANVAVAAEGTCQTDIPVVGDVDGDGSSDLVVGLPGRGTGEVDLRLTTATRPPLTLSNSSIGGQGSAGDQFGAAVVLADLNNDGCDDIIVGAPGANNGAGRVYLVFGAPDGLQTTGGQTFNGGAAAGDRFGSSLAVAPNQAPGTGFDLWVGAPRDDVGSATDAGSVAHYVVTSDALDFSSPVETITQNSPLVPGSAEKGDRFGEALSATSRGVLVGDPFEDMGSRTDAGSITLLTTTDTDDAGFDQAFTWSQDSSGVPGNAESGDHFGAAVSAFDEHLAAGVPDEDVSGLANAGMVQLFSWSSATPLPTGEVKQYIPGVPGKVEAGDRFGAAVVFGRNMGGCSGGAIQIAIGAPGEDIGKSKVDAGTVVIFTPPPGNSCIEAVDQGSPLSDSPEKLDRIGSTLALGLHSDAGARKDRAFIGVPGENGDSGIVQSTPIGSGANSTDITVAGSPTSSVGYSGGAQTGNKYGTVIASPAGE
jgi:FG-GAP repeat